MIEDLGESIYKIRTSSSIYSEAMDPQADTGSPASYPDFKGTAVLDDLRDTEYSYLEEHVYRDYTGAGLAAQSQHRVV